MPMFPRALHYFLFHSATLVRHFAQSFLETHRNHSWGSIAFPVMLDDVSLILLLFSEWHPVCPPVPLSAHASDVAWVAFPEAVLWWAVGTASFPAAGIGVM